MLRGLEGPNHSYHVPSQVLNALERFAAVVEAAPAWQSHVPEGGFIAALRRIENELAENPKTVDLKIDGLDISITLGKYDIQNIATSNANYRGAPDAWARMITAMLKGDFTEAAKRSYRLRRGGFTIWPMTMMMDCASGVSEERLKKIKTDPAQYLLNINQFYFAFCDIWDAPDLGQGFRKNVVSDTSVLFFHGLWDKSTPVENAREIIKGFKNGWLVEVDHASHSVTRQLYQHWPPMRTTVRNFFYGREIAIPKKITLPLPEFKGPKK